MKVLVVQPHGMAPGPSEFSYQYAAALEHAGCDVVLVTASGLVTKSNEEIPWQHARAMSPNSSLVVGRVQGRNFFWRKLATLRSNTKTLTLAMKLARSENADVVHIIDGELISLCLVNIRFGRPKNLFFTYRGYEMGSMGGNFVTRSYQLVRRVLWKVTAGNIHVDAETLQAARNLESAARLPASTVKVIAHPIWSADKVEGLSRVEARKRLGISHDNPLFLIFGHRPVLQKALDTVIAASPHLPSDVQFLIAGTEADSGTDDQLRQMITEYDAAHRFEWHDAYIPDELVESYFAASDALVLSYRRTYIGASGVLSQAATYGLPVIASDSADLGSIVGSKSLGLTFATEQPAAFAKAVETFTGLPESRRGEYIENLNRLRTERSWQNIISMHMDFYSTQLAQHN